MKQMNELFICQCKNEEHQLIFSYFPEEDGDVYMSIHLVTRQNIWKRIKMAIKYVFGYKCQYGNFDEFIFKKEDAGKLQSVVDYLKS